MIILKALIILMFLFSFPTILNTVKRIPYIARRGIPKDFREVLGKDITEEKFLSIYDEDAIYNMRSLYRGTSKCTSRNAQFLERMQEKAALRKQLDKGLYDEVT